MRATNTTCPGTIAKRNPETGTRDARPGTPDEPHTRFGGCVVIVRSSSELTTKPPAVTQPTNATRQNPNQTKPAHQQSTRRDHDARPQETQTEPHTRRSGCVVPSLRENPPDKHPDEPAVRAATQARSARPPNTTIDDIAYHTPAAAGTLSQRENPRTKKGRAQPPATRNPIQEPATTVQKTSSTHPLRRVCGNFKFVILTQHPRPRRTNMGERRPTRQTNPTNGNESKPQCKPRTNPTPAEADILLNPHPPTKSMTPPTENMWPRVRGNPNGEA
ncbi:hypothetical protein BS47DRAFT_1369500 [Hydnum rufescens UP504]|uniref:Uncharacterized protein n=1 Tax=Hydnum rufescens UP504 TaxID=1448309 RepID=A0A9P6ADD6_9AGAM|nr:hypothetical protein BS47DRAFT_1369500 [Hydnum rufescens UP504]